MSKASDNPIRELEAEVLIETVEVIERFRALEFRLDKLEADTVFNFNKLNDLRVELDDYKVQNGSRLDGDEKLIQDTGEQLRDTESRVESLNTLLQTQVQALGQVQAGQARLRADFDDMKTLVQTQGQALSRVETDQSASTARVNQIQSTVTADHATLSNYGAQLSRINERLFHRAPDQHYFNLTIPHIPNAEGKVVSVSMLDAQGKPIVTIKTYPGATVSFEGTPGQQATFQMLVDGTIVDTVTLTA